MTYDAFYVYRGFIVVEAANGSPQVHDQITSLTADNKHEPLVQLRFPSELQFVWLIGWRSYVREERILYWTSNS